jgi:hypothetical protein
MMNKRSFCRFVRSPDIRPGVPTSLVPEAGLCLSVFLVLRDREDRNRVLMGVINREANWEELGALSPNLLQNFPRGWMLPSSHLLLFESPVQASQRVLKEQLDLSAVRLTGPVVFSDVYDHPITHLRNHWDIGFIFKGVLDSREVKATQAWQELRFVDPMIQSTSIIRSHGDVIKYSEASPNSLD